MYGQQPVYRRRLQRRRLRGDRGQCGRYLPQLGGRMRYSRSLHRQQLGLPDRYLRLE